MSTILKRTKKAVSGSKKKPAKPEPAEEVEETETADDAADEPTGDAADDTNEEASEDDTTDAADEADESDEADDADDGDDDITFEDEDVDETDPRDRTKIARQVLVVLALAALVLSGAVFYLLNQVNDARAADEAGDEAVSSARAHAQDLLSYDYRSLDSDFQRGLAATTGGFHTQYQQTTSQLVRPQATQQKVIVQAAVMNAGLISTDGDSAQVLLFVDRVTTKAGQKKPTFNQDRVRMSMTKVNGKWLVSKLDAL